MHAGMPGVQTLLSIMLTHVAAGRLTLERLVDLVSAGPARIWSLAGKGRIAPGYDADLSIVDLAAERRIESRWIASKVGWTIYDGILARGWPLATVVRGRIVMREGEIVSPPAGRLLRVLDMPASADLP
jgi:dihydroorotase